MADITTRPKKVARRYGRVLFELAHKNKDLKKVMGDVTRFRTSIEAEPTEWQRVVSPSLPVYTQRKIMENLLKRLKLGEIMHNFLMVVCQKRRLPDVSAILDAFLECAKQAEGIMEGVLETSLELSDKEINALQKSLTSHLGKKIHLHQKINENLLGGVVLHIGSLMIDGSTRAQLNKLKTAMKG